MTHCSDSDANSHVSSPSFHNHTALLLITALPFLQPAYRKPIEIFAKILELSETLNHQGEHSNYDIRFRKEETQANGLFGLLNSFVLDLDGLLSSLYKVGTGKEKEIIGMILNIMQAKKLYEDYGDVFSSFSNVNFSSEPSKEQNDTLDFLKELLNAD